MTEGEHTAAADGASHDRVTSVDELGNAATKVGRPRAGFCVCVCVCVCVCMHARCVRGRERERE